MPAHWPYLRQAAEDLSRARGISIEDAREALLTEIAAGRRWEGIRRYDPRDRLAPAPNYECITAAFTQLALEERDHWTARYPDMRDDFFDFERNTVWGGFGGRVSYTHVRVSPEGEALPAPEQEKTKTRKTTGNRRGRPVQFDWRRIGIMTAVVLYTGRPLSGDRRITEFRERLEQALGEAGWSDTQIPARTHLETYIRELFDRLDDT